MPTNAHLEATPPKVYGARRHRRYLFSAPVTVHYRVAEGNSRTRGLTLEISEGGVSAIVQGDLRIGEIADLEMPLPVGPFAALAIVRHKTAGRVGFEFLGLNFLERQQLTDTTRALLPQRGGMLGSFGI